MCVLAKSAIYVRRSTSCNSGCPRSLITIRTAVTWIPETVVHSSGVATVRPVRMRSQMYHSFSACKAEDVGGCTPNGFAVVKIT